MPISEVYRKQVSLLVQALPYIAHEPDFALKGGTAINLFVRNLPRLSVDLDLTYLPIGSRPSALRAIDQAMRRIAERFERGTPRSQVAVGQLRPENIATRLLLRSGGVQVKVEVTPVLRGCIHEPGIQKTVPSVEAEFGFAEASVVSFEDLFAGKLVAALDRQHPRDLFDVKGLLDNEGISDRLKDAFVVYIASHNRPAVELLKPNLKDIEREFHDRFDGMTAEPITVADLDSTREALLTTVATHMPDAHREFLISLELGDPDWNKLSLAGVENLPAIKWKLTNVAKLDDGTRKANARKLAGIWP